MALMGASELLVMDANVAILVQSVVVLGERPRLSQVGLKSRLLAESNT
jgi:hypothetical protein